jgi:hypothetical protein
MFLLLDGKRTDEIGAEYSDVLYGIVAAKIINLIGKTTIGNENVIPSGRKMIKNILDELNPEIRSLLANNIGSDRL